MSLSSLAVYLSPPLPLSVFSDLWFLSVQKLQQCRTTLEPLIRLAGGGGAIRHAIAFSSRSPSGTAHSAFKDTFFLECMQKKQKNKKKSSVVSSSILFPSATIVGRSSLTGRDGTGRDPVLLNQDFHTKKCFYLQSESLNKS